MMTPTVSRLLFTSIVTLALACAPNPAFGQHHARGSRGGSGSRSGGSHGGGRPHSGGGRGFHGGGGGHFGGKGVSRGFSTAPRQKGGGSYRRSAGLATRSNSNSTYFGGLRAGSNGPRRINGMAAGRPGNSFARAFAAGTHGPGMNFNSNRAPIAGAASRSWSGQGQSSWASAPRATSSFNSNRPPTAGSTSRNWSGQGQSSWASAPRATSSFNSNRPPTAGSASRSWSGQGQSSWASLSRSTLSFNPNRGLSDFGNSRFGNSAFGHSSFSNSQTGSSVPLFGSSRFGAAHQFDWGAPSFRGESSFGGGDFSIIPDLFGLALNLGGFGLRGLALLGSGLGGFGVPALGLLGSGLGGFSLDAGLESRQWGPGPAFYSTGNLTCPQ
jgi:hypothetical protein